MRGGMGIFSALRLVLCLLAGLAVAAAAEPTRWSHRPYPPPFEHFGRREGLSQGTVSAIFQDHRGFLWFGTEDGLNRYDGKAFKVYRHDPRQPGSLSSGMVTCLAEDPSGQLWVGMSGGLHVLDRATERFRRFQPTGRPGSLSSASISCLLVDPRGGLWIGTDGMGLNHLPPGGDEGAFRTFFKEQGLPGQTVTALLRDRSGTLWVALEDGGLATVTGSPEAPRIQAVQARFGARIAGRLLALAEDHHGRLWLGGPDGLQIFDPARGLIQAWPTGEQGPYVVRRLLVDTEGVLWVGTDGHGLDKVVPPETLPAPPRVAHLHRDPQHRRTLSSNAVESLWEDRTGCLWIGTYLHGLDKLALNRHSPLMRERPAVQEFRPGRDVAGDRAVGCLVSAFLETRTGELWIGMDGGGLERVRPGKPDHPITFEPVGPPPAQGGMKGNVVTCLLEDRKGRIWVGTYTQGLARADRDGNGRLTFRHHAPASGLGSPFTLALWETPQGHLLVGTVDEGLRRFDPETGKAVRIPLGLAPDGAPAPETVFAIHPDSHGQVWVGTNDGLFRLDPGTGRAQLVPLGVGSAAASQPSVRSLHVDRRGVLWVGTQTGGLAWAQVPPPGQVPTFVPVGLQEGPLLGLLEDDRGGIWISGSQGLVRYDPLQNQSHRIPASEGLASDEYGRNAFLRLRSGEFLFGGVGGFILFDPEDLAPAHDPVPVVLTDLELFHQNIAPGQSVDGRVILPRPTPELDRLVLRHKDQVVSFRFAALHYRAPHLNRIAVLLEGLDRTWTTLGPSDHVSYTTLPPGTYVLRVRACVGDGPWGEETRLQMEILPPFWKTGWFFGLLGLLVLGVLRGYVWLRFRTLRKRERILQEQVEARTAELAAANRALEQLATTDPKTGIPNFRAFEDRLGMLWAPACRERTSLALILIDIDHFKAYNDNLGHQAGDDCLKAVAQALHGLAKRGGDLLARYGGEEFILLLRCTASDAVPMTERVRQVVEDLGLPHPASSTGPVVTTSVGCRVAIPHRDEGFEAFLMRADQALYRAKARGRNQVCVDAD